MPHAQQPLFWKKYSCSFDFWSPLLSICTSLEVIIFTAFIVGESGSKSIKAWLSSKKCVTLGSSGIEPALQNKGKKIFFQDMKARYRYKTLWKLTDFNVILKTSKFNQWEFSAICYNNVDWKNNLFCYAISWTQQESGWHSLGFWSKWHLNLHFHTNYILHCLFFIFNSIRNKWWNIYRTIFHETVTICS